ncbi:phospho-sugar mutase [Rothia kristinae]|uniref:phospho-sugar mutase n=1 Tax=Rothia kristinae TaxID=37923 RepID=UPI0007735909|nr:phospho-sugar mutase [Rothia kristinae]
MSDLAALTEQVERWVESDPDPETQRELLDLLSRAEDDPAAARELTERFSGTLGFGTAGLRAALGAGPMRMNRVVVAKAAHGLAAYLTGRAEEESWGAPRAVIGYDARRKSQVFARDTAAIFTAAEIDAYLLPLPLPTPVLAWALRLLKADVGVMVTASHNPAQDNGYKVYLGGHAVDAAGDGAQIVPPYDAEIARCIEAAPDADRIPRADEGWTVLPERIARDYEHQVCDLLPGFAPSRRDLSVVLTPMHGVGGEVASMALSRCGFDQLSVVPEQALPDPAFPTVAFPNPEEPGAMDLALRLAETRGADLVIANDPDADRAAFAIPVPADRAQGVGRISPVAPDWRILRGDEIGAILGQVMLERIPAGQAQSAAFASSIVSSRLLGAMAAVRGVRHVQTLTGFKWISRVPGLVYGYEEALGYCVAPQLARDKDGISAALLLADCADRLKGQGRTLLDVLDRLHTEHGVHAADQLSVRVQRLELIREMMLRLRAQTPRQLAGSPVVAVEDLRDGLAGLPPTDALRLLSEDGSRVIVRPSGTEPKLKCYLETVEPVSGDLPAARARAAERLAAVRADVAAALGI